MNMMPTACSRKDAPRELSSGQTTMQSCRPTKKFGFYPKGNKNPEGFDLEDLRIQFTL